MKVIKFIEPHSPYAPGDIAGLPNKDAEVVIKAGKAVSYKEEKREEEAEDKVFEEAPVDKMVKKAQVKK